jgi:hypothetical protein
MDIGQANTTYRRRERGDNALPIVIQAQKPGILEEAVGDFLA